MSDTNKNAWRDDVNGVDRGHIEPDLTETARSMIAYLLENGINGLDFTGFVPTEVRPIHLCVVLRATCRWRDTIPGWHDAAQVAYNACLYQGINAKKALTGLIK